METVIKIRGRELSVHVTLVALFDYKNTFGTDLLDDIDKIKNAKEDSIGSITPVIYAAFQIIYILHRPYCKEKNFHAFADTFEFDVFQSRETLDEVTRVFSLLFPNQISNEFRSSL